MRTVAALSLLGASAAFGQCVLSPGTGLNLAAISSTRLKSIGESRMVFVFVDFPDAPAGEDARELYRALVPFSQAWYDEVSYGRMKLTVTPVFKWYRMPLPSTAYNFARGMTFDLHKRYIGDAVRVMDSEIDFSHYDGAYILASKNAVPYSPTWVPEPGWGIRVDGVELRHVVTLGDDVRRAIPVYKWHVLTHETGHLMGLPDLYLFAGADVHAPAGSWSNMGFINAGAHYTAWEKRLLGWLRDAEGEFVCVQASSATVDLSPLEGKSGVRGLAVQISPTKAIVAETRTTVGQDARLCDSGLLVYTVDSSVASGNGPLVVQRSGTGTDAAALGRCGSPYAATFDLREGRLAAFRDAASGVSFEILGRTVEGGFRVHVSNPAATPLLF